NLPNVWVVPVPVLTIDCLGCYFNDNLLFNLTIWYCIITDKYIKMCLIIINMKLINTFFKE
ncbi:MAG: hypothetical protein Q8866_02645, partial [Candidatus Phytoplasma australasiaticum]|nr:hypothetical protein [Candidatus Phytoplasma australasiaticum]